jgi:nitrogen fixation protein NifB
VTVKVNSIILPGINDEHIGAIAATMAELKVDILNCIPYYKTAGSAFEGMDEPPPEMVANIRATAAAYLPQMRHCTRCRADAVGLLGEALSADMAAALQRCAQTEVASVEPAFMPDPGRPNVAVASMEGVLVNQHVGEAEHLWIYSPNGEIGNLLETRPTPMSGTGMQRWEDLAGRLSDCHTLLVSGIGENPKTVLSRHGVRVVVMEGLIQEAVSAVLTGKTLKPFMKHAKTVCGAACSGTGTGCG